MLRIKEVFVVIALAVITTACTQEPRSLVVLLPDLQGHVGTVVLTTEKGDQVLSEAAVATTVAKPGAAPSAPFSIPQEAIDQDFALAVQAQPIPPERFLLYFEFESTKLKAESKNQMPLIIAAIQRRPVPDVDVVGHTDRAGDAHYNNDLALKRARAIKTALAGKGGQATRFRIGGHGENNPLVPTKDGAFEPRNRRVEVTIR